MSLPEYRKRIDAIDDRLLELLDERASVAKEIGDAKREAGATAVQAPES